MHFSRTTQLPDQQQRIQALHPKRSFIVQAPAGSGKTELLVQRYLVLLSESVSPEAVLALTFTRKAAAEMKQRVLDTLYLAASSAVPPNEPYQHKRWELGRKLYEWQAKQQWELLANPHRLQIQTIDAFYAQLSRKAPLHSGLTVATQVLENPEPLYQAAIQELFIELEKNSTLGYALVRLAHHLNNDTIQIERLLMHMLAHRDQWVGIIPKGVDSMKRLRTCLEQSLQQLAETAYQTAEQAFSQGDILDWHQQVQSLVIAIYYPSQISLTTPLPPSEFWKLAADVLLTTRGQWRRTITQATLDRCPPSRRSFFKSSLKRLLIALREQEAARLALLTIRQLPPLYYTEPQWQLLNDLFYILNALLVILDFVFQQHHQVDYIAIALQASRLLGEAEDPTELLLSLDYQIQHILIDELQDTSLQQLKFLKRLTEGWQPQDGRTLFLVGDPMQSIYRFRKAEARLFSLVQQSGLGHCKLESLVLSANFRATPALVQWVNHHFEAMKPLIQTRCSQESLFTPSIASEPWTVEWAMNKAVQTHWLLNATPEQEADKVVALVKLALQNRSTAQATGQPSIAILGRARQHLLPILPKLRAENIAYQAVAIETLADKPIIQDLLALTRALSHLGDDVAWLALLRAPWCGASLADLHILMQACHHHCPAHLIWDQLHRLTHLPLSKDSKARLARFVQAIEPIVGSYGRMPLATRVIQAWYRLGGPATQLPHTWHPQDITLFCQCVDEVQIGESIVDSTDLEAKLKQTYVTTEGLEKTAEVTLMTIHKAKGLEFDTVILPSLHKSTRSSSHPLILWDELPTLTATQILLAPIKASDTSEPDAIYRYLRQRDAQHYQAEIVRLLYVACTRAKKELHLVGAVQKNDNGGILSPNAGTFLHWLWSVLDEQEKTSTDGVDRIPTSTAIERYLKRMMQDSEYPVRH